MDSPSQEPRAASRRRHERGRLFWIFFWTLFASALTSSAYLLLINGHLPLPGLPSSGTRIEFTDTGSPQWLSFTNNRLSMATGPAGFGTNPAMVIESAPTQVNGNHIVLTEGADGIIALGTLSPNNDFTAVISDQSIKSDVAARADGFVMFAEVETSRPATSTKSATTLLEGKPLTQSVVEQLIQLGSPVPSRLKILQIQGSTEALRDFGVGRSPRLAPDGFFIALAPEGVIRMDPVLDAGTVLIPFTGANSEGSSISPDGSMVALYGKNGLQFYHIQRTSPAVFTFVGFIPEPEPFPSAFVDDSHFITITGSKSAALYTLPPTSGSLSSSGIRLLLVTPMPP